MVVLTTSCWEGIFRNASEAPCMGSFGHRSLARNSKACSCWKPQKTRQLCLIPRKAFGCWHHRFKSPMPHVPKYPPGHTETEHSQLIHSRKEQQAWQKLNSKIVQCVAYIKHDFTTSCSKNRHLQTSPWLKIPTWGIYVAKIPWRHGNPKMDDP